MSLRHYINLIERLAAVPPTLEPTTTPEEQSIDDAPEPSAEPVEPRQRRMPVMR